MLSDAVKMSKTNAEVCKLLGIKTTGGSYGMIGWRIKKLGLDTSHFDRLNGRTSNRKTSDQILVKRESGNRSKTHQLRRALIECGVPYRCSSFGCHVQDSWNGKSIVLEIDHVNRDPLDNRIENLRFLCPNCHSQV